jgi:hypothetical protein
VHNQPAQAADLVAEVELSMDGPHPPVSIAFRGDVVLVEDGPATAPDLRISGSLGDLVSLMVTPLLGGVPSLIRGRGRAALGLVAQRRVRIEGSLALMRRFLSIIRI